MRRILNCCLHIAPSLNSLKTQIGLCRSVSCAKAPYFCMALLQKRPANMRRILIAPSLVAKAAFYKSYLTFCIAKVCTLVFFYGQQSSKLTFENFQRSFQRISRDTDWSLLFGLFCKSALFLYGSFAKEPCKYQESTDSAYTRRKVSALGGFYGQPSRDLTFSNFQRCRLASVQQKFSKMSATVIVFSQLSSELTFESF